MLLLQRAWVQYLARDLRYHRPLDMANKNKNKHKNTLLGLLDYPKKKKKFTLVVISEMWKCIKKLKILALLPP